MTIPFNSFNKEYLKQYLIGPASPQTSQVGKLNLSTALGLKSRLIQYQYERLQLQSHTSSYHYEYLCKNESVESIYKA